MNTAEEMLQTVDKLMRSDQLWEEAGQCCMQCFVDEHSLETVTNRYTELFYDLYETGI